MIDRFFKFIVLWYTRLLPYKLTKFNHFFMNVALQCAKLSHCKRKQVGCVIVKGGNIISIGYNGTPAGEDNCCEDETGELTKYNVIHAEDNALRKLMVSHESSVGADVYCTLMPCERCASLLLSAKIKRLFYHQIYSCKSGIQKLEEHGVKCVKLS